MLGSKIDQKSKPHRRTSTFDLSLLFPSDQEIRRFAAETGRILVTLDSKHKPQLLA
jgi:hypothetical protein